MQIIKRNVRLRQNTEDPISQWIHNLFDNSDSRLTQTQLDRETASQKANTTRTLTRERERQKQPHNLLFRAGTNEEFHIF